MPKGNHLKMHLGDTPARQSLTRFIESKMLDQQVSAVLFGGGRIVHPCNELVNTLRVVFYEFGQILPQGIAHN